jgi:hypothetical protein
VPSVSFVVSFLAQVTGGFFAEPVSRLPFIE